MDHPNNTKNLRTYIKANGIAPVLTLILALPSCSPTAVVGGVASTVTSTVGAAVGTAASVGTTAGKAVGTAAKTAASVGTTAGKAVGTAANVASTGASGAATAARSVGAATTASPGSAAAIPPTAAAAGALASSANAPANQASDPKIDAIGASISQAIVASMLFCTKFEKEEYRIDCFANQLEQVSQTTPDDADFGQARSILANTATELTKVVERRASKTLGQVTLSLSSGQGRTSSRAITAVETDQLPAALSEAESIIEEAKTLLLRASEQSDRRKVAYVDIAQAVGSTKVLLRSA